MRNLVLKTGKWRLKIPSEILPFIILLSLFLNPATAAAITSVNLPRTGQTTCYDEAGTFTDCTGTGQDGDILAGAEWPTSRFTTGTGGEADCIIDNLTGLMWPKNANLAGTHKTWDDALTYSNSLTYCGHSDWRLPNINEIESLVNYGEAGIAAWLHGQDFSNIQTDYSYWSSTSRNDYFNQAWRISFTDNAFSGMVSSEKTAVYSNVWPVRAGTTTLAKTGQTTCYDTAGNVISCTGTGQDGDVLAGVEWPNPRFTAGVGDKADCITDNLTGLMWPKKLDISGYLTWFDALTYSNSFSLCGYTDWRLPNIKEIGSLANYGEAPPMYNWLKNQGFTGYGGWHWSSTTHAPYSARAMQLVSNMTYLRDGEKNEINRALPVRGGALPSLNSAPVITSNGGGATASVNAAESQTAVTTVTATDADGDPITYSISGGADLAKFSINSTSGMLTFSNIPDLEAPTDSDTNNTYVVEVTVFDGSYTDTQTISVTVMDVDEVTPTTTAFPAGGTYTSAQSVTLTCNDGSGSGCDKIYYTTDGSTPTTSSSVYSSPITISSTTTLKFFAVDLAGNSESMKAETYIITAISSVDTTPPANVSNLNAVSNADGSVSLSWTAPADADLNGYNIYRNNIKINSTLIKSTGYRDTTAVNGSTYTYKVTSLDLAGNESSGTVVNGTSSVQANMPPSAPVNVKVENQGTGYSLKVTWTANTEADLAGYKVYWGTASGTYANSQNVGNVTSYTIPGLTDGTRYYIAISAYDADGLESGKSIECSIVPKAVASRPDLPTELTVTEGNKYLTLSWTGVSNVTGYMVYIGEADGVYGTPVRTTDTSYTFRNLQNGKTYYVAVSSYDLSSGSRYTVSSESEKAASSGIPYDNEAPAVPANLSATVGTGGSVTLKWDREESFDIAGYVVAYKQAGSSAFSGMTSIGVSWSHTVTGLADGIAYTFYVYAYDESGNFSDPSSVSATPINTVTDADVTPPSAPNLSAAPGNGKVTLMITPPSDSDIDRYNLYVYNLEAGKYMPLASISGLSYEHSTGVENGQALVFVATAVDLAGNESGYSGMAGSVPNELPGDIPLEEDPPVLDRVDGYDINEIVKGFGSEIGNSNYNPNADLDGDGFVNGNDLMVLAPNHGKKK